MIKLSEALTIARQMKIAAYILLAIFFSVFIFACASPQQQPNDKDDVLFQTSTLNALMEGVYDGDMTFGELRAHGDFGIGTFDALDGEMVEIDRQVYQIKADGIAHRVDDTTMKSPFAVVTFFEPDQTASLDKAMDCVQLEEFLDSLLPTKNIPYALRIEGAFAYLKTRSVPRQTEPYPPLVEVLENQPIFEFQNVTGVMVGFRLPGYMEGVNAPGYHFHFLTEDRTAGGHVLECQSQNVTIGIDYTDEWYVVLPEGGAFYEVDFTSQR